jgi:hypothetical protein
MRIEQIEWINRIKIRFYPVNPFNPRALTAVALAFETAGRCHAVAVTRKLEGKKLSV